MITINELPNFKSEIVVDNTDEFNLITNYLTVEYVSKAWDWKIKRWVDEKTTFHAYEKTSDNKILITKAMAITVSKYLLYLDIDHIININITQPFKCLDKWINTYTNHPKPDKGKIQLETINKITNTENVTNYGIISLYTGIGKTELLLGLAESYLEQYDKNVLIIGFANKVLDEISSRADKYGVKLGERLRLYNPAGYYRSNYSKEDEAKEWLSNVGLVLADEAHHFTSLDGTWAKIIFEANPDFVYGFSASADVEDGAEINFLSPTEKDVSVQIMCMLSFCGTTIIHQELPNPISVTEVHTNITDKSEYKGYKDNNPHKMAHLIQLFLRNEKTPHLLRNIILNELPKDAMVFIPEITSIETGSFLASRLNQLGIPTVYISASTCITPVGEVIDLPLEDLKYLASINAFKVLIANVVGVEGIDIPNLNSVIPLTGAKFKSFIQPLGRSARSDLVHCVFVFDKYNAQLNRQMSYKQDITTKRLNVIKHKKIYL